ncbi:hypothetical protein P280DRAFT_521966 [Massarina eburnea CBS 473.64]|uniref:Uncharacterized protein n=1 Tax=Massarina eburnea CBS 473.64 TaxID=1395130 RepID=A0A6A6RQY8_9PLEO|nr:hypothetical protein P280DRAFT_521966 [Massarina eburnea CBS 473.64]
MVAEILKRSSNLGVRIEEGFNDASKKLEEAVLESKTGVDDVSTFLNADISIVQQAFQKTRTDTIRHSSESSKMIQRILKKTKFTN